MNINNIQNAAQLEQTLSEPSQGAIAAMSKLEGDLLVLGVGGKMGPTLAMMAKRASDQAGVKRRVIGVSRFSSNDLEDHLHHRDIETIRADLLDPEQLDALPDAANVVYLVGMKFGSSNQEPLTWAMNTFLPGMVCRRYKNSRIAVLSTGNVYGMTPLVSGGSRETDPLNPDGDYATSCMGRERIVEHFSRNLNIATSILRLNYAVELRYGVLVDLALQLCSGNPIDVTMGNFNIIWQADANAMILQSLLDAGNPPLVLNVAGPETLSARCVSRQMAEMMNIPVQFRGQETDEALLSNGQEAHRRYGYPRVSAKQMIEKVASWIKAGGQTLDKPTHFQTRDGKF